MSLRAVADAAGIDPATLSRIENGKTQLTPDLAQKIAKVLHVSITMFYAEPGVLETAMLRMRKAPLLTPRQIFTWRGPDTFEEAPDQVYLHAAIEDASRNVFAFEVVDAANEPAIRTGDKLLFDALREPRLGDVVLAQTPDAQCFIGAYRPGRVIASFDVIPGNRLYRIESSAELPLKLRGVLFELRRNF